MLHGEANVHIVPVYYAGFCSVFVVTMMLSGATHILYDANASLAETASFAVPLVVVCISPLFLLGLYKAKTYQARQDLRTQIAAFDIDRANCFCCSVKHALPNGDQIDCDREFIETSIDSWYGDAEGASATGLANFNSCVRTSLSASTEEILGLDVVLPVELLLIWWNGEFYMVLCNAFLIRQDTPHVLNFLYEAAVCLFCF